MAYRIALIPGDGIGQEVIPEGVRVLHALERRRVTGGTLIPDGDRAGDDAFSTLTAGANYYLHGHAARFTADIQWFLDDTAGNDLVSGVAATGVGRGVGLLPSAEADQVALRLQFQLLF